MIADERDKHRIVLAVDLDYFFAQCEEVRRPEIKSRPVVVCVYSGRTEDSGAVSTSNYIARKLGVRSGIPIINAKRILKDHPEAVFLPIDKEYYESISERVMEILRSEANSFERVSIDEAFLDVSNKTERDFAEAEKLARKVKRSILDSEGLTCSVGVSTNKLLAKMAADRTKPDGLTVVTPDRVHEFLDDLAVGKLQGIGPKTEQKLLQSMGVRKASELAAADLERLASEFGSTLGPRLRDIARGIDDSPVTERGVEQLSRIITLKHDATSPEDFFAEEVPPLVSDISARLESMKLRCSTVSIIAITSELKTKTRARSLGSPTRSEEVILEASRDLFARLFTSENTAGVEKNEAEYSNHTLKVRRIGVRVAGLVSEKNAGAREAPRGPTLTDYFAGGS